jgi:hypothetical protein
MEAVMLIRMRVPLFLVLFLFTSLAVAGGKKKVSLPAFILKARTVTVLIDPDAGIDPAAPQANRTAQDDVEKALMKWGRLTLTQDPQLADIVIVIRKGNGKIVRSTIGGMPTNDRPVTVQQTDNAIHIAGQQGRSAGAPQQPLPQDTRPTPQTEAGSADDTFAVYQGHEDNRSFDQQVPAWRYAKKDALHSPTVPAVDAFRKQIDEAEKQQKSNP